MKILWCEMTTPSRYNGQGEVVCGWQDALENIIKDLEEVELYITFEGSVNDTQKVVEGVTYIPIPTQDAWYYKKYRELIPWKYNERRVIEETLKVIDKISPDLIHVFGMEWSWASIASKTDIPCVVHIMGSMVPYYNALYPPRYSSLDYYKALFPNIVKMLGHWQLSVNIRQKMLLESIRWRSVKYYMGRTNWDLALVRTLHPDAKYYHVEEALRPQFYEVKKKWCPHTNNVLKLVTTGSSNFWKGPDMIL